MDKLDPKLLEEDEPEETVEGEGNDEDWMDVEDDE